MEENKIYKATVSLDVDTVQKLKSIAKKDERSLASLMRKVLIDYANSFEINDIEVDDVQINESVSSMKRQLPPLKK